MISYSFLKLYNSYTLLTSALSHAQVMKLPTHLIADIHKIGSSILKANYSPNRNKNKNIFRNPVDLLKCNLTIQTQLLNLNDIFFIKLQNFKSLLRTTKSHLAIFQEYILNLYLIVELTKYLHDQRLLVYCVSYCVGYCQMLRKEKLLSPLQQKC